MKTKLSKGSFNTVHLLARPKVDLMKVDE